ncbi:hypothetical protein [Candidatus Mycoplasma haematominutum]|uniref:Uncharacterized protein n=1 Tax=Candidatus Mycoplasma haematominutum 'Birmingham 1' TaxID=1116213 RepID=G8C2W3_9MOLU|nr:hypothetical protein [Candidatus Mycoplasma haematominutum]CCE66661.1 conserved haemoplasma hypothetical protein [Candidatus Mycoplasma haematominutum 'Birmingham 1']
MSEKLTLEQIEDQELAQLFMHKNFESTSSEKSFISDIFVHSREEFFEKNPTPSKTLYQRLQSEEGIKDSITKSLEKALEAYHSRREFRKKMNALFRLSIRKKGELMTMNIPFLGADYRYFYTYLAYYKKELKASWGEFNAFVDITLKIPGNFAKLKKFELRGAGALLMLIIGLLVARTFLSNWESIKSISAHSHFFSSWLEAMLILCILAGIALVFPYIVLGIFYFININYLYQSKYFHYFIVLCSLAAGILFLLAFFNFLFYQYILLTGGWGIVDLKYQSDSAQK